MEFKDRFKKIIREKGITLEQIAAKMKNKNGEIGISQASLSGLIINGNPTLDKLRELSDIIGVPVSSFVSDNESGLNALIESNGNYYKANTIEELENIINKIKYEL